MPQTIHQNNLEEDKIETVDEFAKNDQIQPKPPTISKELRNKLLKVASNNGKLHNRPESEMSFQSVNEISLDINSPDKMDKGSLCNRFNIVQPEIETAENDEPEVINVEKPEEEENLPPKIWISKSASMDEDLQEDSNSENSDKN